MDMAKMAIASRAAQEQRFSAVKRLSLRYQHWLVMHAVNLNKRRLISKQKLLERRNEKIGEARVRVPKGESINHLVVPRDLSLSRNYDDVMRLIWGIRKIALGGRKGRLYVDLNAIEYISPAATLLLVAEFDRWRRARRTRLRPRDVETMNPQVLYRLAEMGFFRILEVADHPRLEPSEDGVLVLEFCSGVKSDAEAASRLSEQLLHISCGSLGGDELLLNDAIAEAMTNSVQHAYPETERPKYPWLEGTWWATGSYDSKRNILKVLVYDQGVGIPATLPRSRLWEKIAERLSRVPVVREFVTEDAALIEAAIEEGRSATKADGRGLGLAEIVQLAEGRAGSHLRIISGKGEILVESGQSITRKSHNISLGGTLVEISLSLS
jgi:anti-sigma regulatory factor (Ser/Thr protein kinase)